MTKIQTILSLFLFLVIIFSMDMIFGNPLRETFNNRIGLPGGENIGINGVGSKLKPRPIIKMNSKNGNMRYSGFGYLGIIGPSPKSDDQPLFYGFSS